MTTPIDTTRLRERAEAVRDAGVKSTYAHHVVKRLVDAGHSDLTSARKDAREAAETLRGAQKRLYRDAPPDGIIIALLDEVERLRAVAAQVPSDVEFFALRAVASEDPEDITDDESTLACEYVERVKHLRTKRPEEGSTR